MDRRKFLQIIGMAGAAAALPFRFNLGKGLQWSQAHAFAVSPGLKMFGQNLRGVGPGGIPVAAIDGTPAPVTHIANHYTINIGEFTDSLHPDLGPTRLWGFNPKVPLGGGNQPQKHLGGIIVAQKGKPIQITFQNQLSSNAGPTGTALPNLIPVDTTIPGANGGALQNRIAIHLHGGHIPWYSDGGPFDWFDHQGNHGQSFLNNVILNPAAKPGQAEYYYTMDQSARLVWYHDHAFGITRINAYAGVASALIIRDKFEANLVKPRNLSKLFGGLPEFIETSVLAGRNPVELPLVFQDKIFVNGATIGTDDPSWATVARGDVQSTGSLWYAHINDSNNAPDPSVVPEFFGDTMLVNGTVYPTVNVQAQPYRFRILNACNARFVNLQLFQADGSKDGITLDATGKPGPTNPPYTWKGADPVIGFDPDQTVAKTSKCLVIGNEGGFLTKPVAMPLNKAFNPVTLTGSLLMAPAERLDVIIDFTGWTGTSFILYSDTPAPFPVGDPGNDFLPNGTGSGPNTRELLKITVGDPPKTKPPALFLPAHFNLQPAVDGDAWNDPLIFPLYTPAGFPVGNPKKIDRVRQLTLNEDTDEFGRLIQRLGTNQVQPGPTFGQPYLNNATETPSNGDTEIWEIANLTGDTHPIHFHLVNVQVLSRQAFDVVNYNGTPKYLAAKRPPDPDERGWKETVKMHPGEVTRVAMTFDLPKNPPKVFPSAKNNQLLSPRTGGNEYVWHCHILEHEEHDMMRPLVVF